MKNRPLTFKAITLAGITVLTGCGGLYNNYDTNNPDPIDRASGKNRKDFIDNLTPAPKPEVEQKVQLKTPPIPKMSDVLTAPTAPKVPSDKTVTISVTDDIQLKDVFLELSRLADLDIEVESGIQGGVIFKAKDMPISEVLERITNLAGLRYSVKNGVVRIENDEPFIKTYQASFLNVVRTSSGQIGADTKLQSGTGGSGGGGSGGGGSGGGGSNGSDIKINSANGGAGDIWATIEKEMNKIVRSVPVRASSSSSASTQMASADGSSGPGSLSASDAFVMINREAGSILVKANEIGHQKLKEYLDQVKYYYSSQVLIEAKVVEVSLNDQFRSGIDWSLVTKNSPLGNGIDINTDAIEGFPEEVFTNGDNIFTMDFKRGDITAAVELAQVFGTTRTLSSPRILVMNNQQAILSFARNETYFTIDCTQNDAVTNNGDVTTPAKVNVTSQINTIPVGVILNLQSSIDTGSNDILMNIRPTLSRLTGEVVNDPATTICLANAVANGASEDILQIQSGIPQVDVREMDSVLRLKNNEVMVIGGMIEQVSNNTDTGIPWASDIPVLGNAFKKVDKRNQAVQTVIFLKATIVPGYGVDGADQNLYNKFNTDPRAFKF